MNDKVKNIFVARSVAETSMPYIVKIIKNNWGKNTNIILITRSENSDVMCSIKGISNVLTINTTFFNESSKITKQLNLSQRDIVVVPINNIKSAHSYDNVVQFMQKNLNSCMIYYCSFAQQDIYPYNSSKIKNLIKSFIFSISFVLAIPFYVFFITVSSFKILFFKKKQGLYLQD